MKYKLAEICAINYGKDHKRLAYGTIPVYGSGGIMRYANEALHNKASVLIPRKGTLGNLFYVDKPFWTVDTLFWTDIDISKVIPRYLYYSLKIKNLASLNVGTAVPSLTTAVLNDVEINLSSLKEQQHVVDILAALDDKIELNRKMNENLELQAAALFKHWFIDFEFPDAKGKPYRSSGGKMKDSPLGLIPDEWEYKSLTEMAIFSNGLAMQKYRPMQGEDGLPVLKIKELRQGYCDQNSDRCTIQLKDNFIVNDGDIIFSWSGTLLVDLWTGGNCGLNQHLFKVTSDDYPKWLYYLWTKWHLDSFIRIAKDKAVTMGHIKRGDLNTSYVAIPNDNHMLKFDTVFSNMISEMINLRIQCRELAVSRNTLLPVLMK